MSRRLARALGWVLICWNGLASAQEGRIDEPRESCALVWSVPTRASGFVDFDKVATDANDFLALGLLDNALLNGFALKTSEPTSPFPLAAKLTKADLAQFDCLRQVWVSHEFGAQASGEKYFEFRVSVVHFTVSGDSATWVFDFDKRYRFRGLPDVRHSPGGEPLALTVFREILDSHALDATYDPQPDSPMVREEYTRRAARASENVEVHLRHIVVKNPAIGASAIARLNAGQPFARVARDLSLDAKAKLDGGDQGWIKLDALPDDVKSTVLYLEPKGRSPAPVQTAAGWQVIEVMDERKEQLLPFDEVKTAIAADMKDARKAQSIGVASKSP